MEITVSNDVSVATIEKEAAHQGTSPEVRKYVLESPGFPPALIPKKTQSAR